MVAGGVALHPRDANDPPTEVNMLRSLILLALAACAPDTQSPPLDVVESLAAEAAPAPTGGHLTLGVSPLISGGALTLRAEGASAGETVYFARGSGYVPGATCPPVLDGLCLNLAGATLLGTAIANGSGVATLNLVLPAGMPPSGANVSFVAAVANPGDTTSQVEPRVAMAMAGPYTVGATTPYEGFSAHSPNFILGNPILVVTGGLVESFGWFGNTGGSGRLSLWTDAGGQPGTLVAESVVFPLPSGTATPLPRAGAFQINPGKYWLMGHYDVGAAPGMGTADFYTVVAYNSTSFGAGSPPSFGPASIYTGQAFNYWLNMR